MSLALFTIAQDETDSLRLWLATHKKYAPEANFYVLDHDSAGDAAEVLQELSAAGVTVVPVRHALSFDYDWLARVVEDFLGFLLRSHDVVGFSEVDELLVPNTAKYATLHELLADAAEPFYRATGYSVVHHHPAEPDMDWTQPVLAQRRHWYPTQRYSKICLARHRVFYSRGFHAAHNVSDAQESHPDLLCVHLHQADYKTTLMRHHRNAGRIWDGRFRISPEGVHQRLDNPADLERYLLADLDAPEQFATLRAIPEQYKQYRICLNP